MWHTTALLEGVDGVAVTPGVVRFYSGKDVASARQVQLLNTPIADEILRQIERLAEHDGKWLSCARIKDGWSLDVEGATSTRIFSFTAHVPNICTEGLPKDVFDIYERLSMLRERRPN